ncbi:GTP-binding protein [Nocardiopsis sp. N85]|uniref:CobW family GTP-binding protein n=1 Tax=Nocardiopsis sp. N85 TaxID=3029400 RepID=UPI00237FD2E5|nr:GTP-binding protein [Nocardiopsis sp. N85]MDE3724633.1 GTP-binding protein [Nocardiopsis sp. N85]
MRVAVITGLHRDARERTVRAALTVPRTLVVHHDLSEIDRGTVYRVVRDPGGTVDRARVDLVHACASCTLREDLVPFLLDLAARGDHDLCVVDAWDGVEPRSVAEAIAARDELVLTAVVTAVDADRLLPDLAGHDELADRGLDIAQDDDRAVSEVLSRQIEYPTAIALHGRRHLAEARALVEHLNPAAAVMDPTDTSALTAGRFDTAAAHNRTDPLSAHHGEHSHGRVRTVVWSRRRPVHPTRLHDAMDGLVSMSLRGRGRLWLGSRPDTVLVWDSHRDMATVAAAGPWLAALPEAALDLVPEARRTAALLDWDPAVGDRGQHLAFTGVDLDTDRLIALLDSCLLTDDETASTFADDPFAAVEG